MGGIVKTICVVGLGLIGGSIVKGCRRDGLAREIVGVDRDGAARLVASPFLDRVTPDVGVGAAQADLILFATPVASIGPLIKGAAPVLAPGAVVTDVGSVKAPVVADAEAALGESNPFVGGHPIAGTERSGFGASRDDLFVGQLCVLTPGPRGSSDGGAVGMVVALWEGLGSHVVTMEADHHDRLFAAVSHLPHLIAYALVSYVAGLEKQGMEGITRFTGGGFRDFTRIAGSHPEMWRDIFTMNRARIMEALDGYIRSLTEMRGAIEEGETERLYDLLDACRTIREGLPRG